MRNARTTITVLTITTMLLLLSTPAGAADSTTSTARMVTGSSAITDEGSPSNTAGVLVFAGVCAVIVIGALVLFLRHRRATRV